MTKTRKTGTPHFHWRWSSAILLGVLSNFLVNAIFNFRRPIDRFHWDEYLNAIIASFILLEGMRWISRKLDKKYPWQEGARKRITIQLGLHVLFIAIGSNLLLLLVHALFYDGFYSMSELMVINAAILSLALIFTIVETSVHFYTNWSDSSITLAQKESDIEKLLDHESKKAPLEVLLGNTRHLIPQEELLCALSESRVVYLCTADGRKLPYSNSLDALYPNLDPLTFFRVNRQMILNRSAMTSVKSLPQGKIQVNLAEEGKLPQSTIISRLKAAEFRKWLKEAS